MKNKFAAKLSRYINLGFSKGVIFKTLSILLKSDERKMTSTARND